MRDSEDGAGAIVGLFVLFLTCGIIFAVTGAGIDRLTLIISKMFVDTAMMQGVFDVFALQSALLRVEPFIVLVAGGISFWITRSRTLSGDVDIAGTVMSGAEMVLTTFILMVFGIFGGFGLASIVGVVNAWNFQVQDDQYFLIMYLPSVFSWVILMLSIAAVAMFVINQFKIVDYQTMTEYN